MHTDERTIADLFAAYGYATGMVGKWHLGDNAPHRPQDRGFKDVVWHRCGGVGQASDYWENDYFDDTYEVVVECGPARFEKFEGYCTDVWFAEARAFIERHKQEPFFLYLATNAPHGPYRVPDKWKEPYEGKVTWRAAAEFYGMIANIDHNVGKLRKRLTVLGLAENTILIFMTDNGTSNGARFDGLTSEAIEGFNAGMRGKKSSIYDGGHRVPFFVHWPAGNIGGGRDVTGLTAHLDVLPTLADLCGIPAGDRSLDGKSFATALRNPSITPARKQLVVQFQGGAHFRGPPAPWEHSCVLEGRWRLINGSELYDVSVDPAQRNDVAASHPDVIQRLKQHYWPFWEGVSPRMVPVSIDLGSASQNPTTLCSQDWYMPTGNPPWNFGSIKKLPRVTGPWNVHVRTPGLYRFTLRQWPKEANKPITGNRAEVQIAGKVQHAAVEAGSSGVDMELDLPAGKTQLRTWFFTDAKEIGGAYFTDVELVESAEDRRRTARGNLLRAMQSVMGEFPGDERRVELDIEIEEEVDAGSYLRRLVTFQSEPGCRTPAYICVPKSVLQDGGKTPAVLCLHPTDNQAGHQVVVGLGGREGRQYAAELAERGFVTIAPAYPQLANYWPNLGKLGYVSGTMKAIWDNTRAMDVLASLPYVDDSRGFGAIGHSLGGHNGIFTAAFDERISALVSSCGFDSFEDYYDGNVDNWYFGKGWCQVRYMPRMSNYRRDLKSIPFDFPDLLESLAPRKVLINAPLHDSNFRWKSVDKCVTHAKSAYAELDARANLTVRHPDCGHDFPKELREESYKMLQSTLAQDK